MGEQAFQILRMLLEAPGEIVTREELRSKLWANDTFVDFDHGLNSAIQRLRDSLSDSAAKPRWIETVPRRGYRFVGQVEWSENNRSSEIENEHVPRPNVEDRKETSGDQTPLQAAPQALAVVPSSVFRHKRALFVAATLILVVVAGFLIARRVQQSRLTKSARLIQSIAILPLENLSGDPNQDYFADGMTDELITMLAKNTSLRVVSRTSAMQYKGVNRPVNDIARELGVDGILEGSIERYAKRVHMTVQLIYAPTDSHVWAESYDRDLNQAFLLLSELSQTVAKEVQAKTVTSTAHPPRYLNPEAHEAYLHGRYFWFTHDVSQTLPYFEKAIQLQPDYAAAWSGLADTYALAGMTGYAKPLDAMAKAEAAARKALELDESLPEAHNSMAAWYLFYGWDPQRAEEECKRAIELNPNYAEVHHLRHYVLLAMNRPDEATAEEKRSVELDQYARSWGLGALYIALRQYDAAINELLIKSQVRRSDPLVHWNLAEAYWLKGMYKESQQEYEKGIAPEMAAAAHKAWLKGGEKAVAQWAANNIRAQARQHYVPTWALAKVIAHSGDKDETLKYLEAAYREHNPSLIDMPFEPIFDFLHDDPRYQALVKKLAQPTSR
jgi:TolB-like protein/DNA-binding winged helix-turn-helix (wHTH) protein/Tfp pilus assembly protein PilF